MLHADLSAGVGGECLAERIVHCNGHGYVVARLGLAHACKIDQRERSGRIIGNCVATTARTRTPLVVRRVTGGLPRRQVRRILELHLRDVHLLLVFIEQVPLALALLPINLRARVTLAAELPVEEKSAHPSVSIRIILNPRTHEQEFRVNVKQPRLER